MNGANLVFLQVLQSSFLSSPFMSAVVVLYFAGVPGSMVVTWTTFSRTDSRVEYGLLGSKRFEMSAKGDATLFVDSGKEKRNMFIHRVTLTGLHPAASYGGRSFSVGSVTVRGSLSCS